MSEPLLSVKNLRKVFPITKGVFARKVGEVRAVHDVSFDIAPGETLSLVGESGCGKTTTGRAILRLIEPTSGEVKFAGRDVLSMSPAEMRAVRREMQIIFQDPVSSLNPRMTVGAAIREGIAIHKLAEGAEADKRV
ncbi:MAG: ATP-binding cassette domain-containing protein, partial [Gemmatimonadales bacterium]